MKGWVQRYNELLKNVWPYILELRCIFAELLSRLLRLTLTHAITLKMAWLAV